MEIGLDELDRESTSPQRGRCRLEDLWSMEDQDFLDRAFRVILGRPADPASWEFFQTAMTEGRFSRVEVLGHLQKSPEGRRQNIEIPGLRTRFLLARAARRIPLLGPLFGLLVDWSLVPLELRHIRRELVPARGSVGTKSAASSRMHEDHPEEGRGIPHWAGDPRAGQKSSMTAPFDFKDVTRKAIRELVPSWFRSYWHPSESAIEHWEEQYRRALGGEDFELPQDTMRHPVNELHQRMALEFWEEVPRDFDSILDVGCSDGFMVKVFQDAGKNAVGINDFLYPTDRLYIDEHELQVREMDMHAIELEDGTFDAVWCRHTLEHSFAPLRVLAEIYRILRPGGYLFVVLPPPPQPPEAYPGHWHQIPEYQLDYLLRLCDFEILELRTAWFSFQQENDNLEIRAICRKRVAQEPTGASYTAPRS